MLMQAHQNKKERRKSNKMPSGCEREMVSSDERLKEIRRGKRYCRVGEAASLGTSSAQGVGGASQEE
jgi:hypothetical protein